MLISDKKDTLIETRRVMGQKQNFYLSIKGGYEMKARKLVSGLLCLALGFSLDGLWE